VAVFVDKRHQLHPPRVGPQEPDGEDLGADEVEEDLLDDLEHRLLVERRVELVPRDVEVEEVLVLALHLLETLAEILVLAVQGVELGLDLLELPLEREVLARGVRPGSRRLLGAGQLLLHVEDTVAEPLVLPHHLLDEGLALGEVAHHVLGGAEELLDLAFLLLGHDRLPPISR
jgi:hypothetical protein